MQKNPKEVEINQATFMTIVKIIFDNLLQEDNDWKHNFDQQNFLQ